MEAINEDLVAKQRLFHAIEDVAGPEALVTSSSSGIPPTELFARCRRQDRCLVAHPLNPPELIPLVELVPGAQTTAAMVARAHDYLRALGRMPIDRKSTRLNSSHQIISYAVFCLKKKNTSNYS